MKAFLLSLVIIFLFVNDLQAQQQVNDILKGVLLMFPRNIPVGMLRFNTTHGAR